jgi:hypothetical protein
VQVHPEVESQPVQPANALPDFAEAVSVTAVPGSSWAVQVAPQSMPFPETVPEPDPTLVTVTVLVVAARLNVAVTVRFAASVRVHVVPEVESHPDHPVKREVEPAAAVRETALPVERVAVQVFPQSIPLPVTVPDPDPERVTVRTLVLVPGAPEPPPQASIQTSPSIAVESSPPRRRESMGDESPRISETTVGGMLQQIICETQPRPSLGLRSTTSSDPLKEVVQDAFVPVRGVHPMAEEERQQHRQHQQRPDPPAPVPGRAAPRLTEPSGGHFRMGTGTHAVTLGTSESQAEPR